MNETRGPAHPILVVDDEHSILTAIDTTLRMAGFDNIITCQDPRQVMDLYEKGPVEVMLLDLAMPHLDGEDLLSLVNREHPDVPVIIVTGSVEVETAVRCMKKGAFDYLIKPVDEGQLITAINRALSFSELRRENMALKQHILSDTLEHPEAFREIVTNSKKMLAIFQYIESIAPTSQPVLIRGETGVGKELIARSVHKASGVDGPFVAVNVAGLDDNVFSDTLFGHLKGAFTGADAVRKGLIEKAAGGTLFLDEIGDLSQASQVKLLRLLQEREYMPLGADEPKRSDVRIVASTNKDLRAMQRKGRFRKDLHYRLRTHHIFVPPLRERMEDIRLLTDHLLEKAATALGKVTPTPPRELYDLLATHMFPGNIRELQAMIFDAVSRHKSKVLSMAVFKAHITREQEESAIGADGEPDPAAPVIFPMKLPSIKQMNRLLVEEAMKRANNNQSLAAAMLGITQQALSKRLKSYS